jgi:hypothetical protein
MRFAEGRGRLKARQRTQIGGLLHHGDPALLVKANNNVGPIVVATAVDPSARVMVIIVTLL